MIDKLYAIIWTQKVIASVSIGYAVVCNDVTQSIVLEELGKDGNENSGNVDNLVGMVERNSLEKVIPRNGLT
jgi:hypothetical protein